MGLGNIMMSISSLRKFLPGRCTSQLQFYNQNVVTHKLGGRSSLRNTKIRFLKLL